MTTVTMPEITGGISIDELTSADGSGVLDVMLGSIKALLHEEYKQNRIRGTDYANAFVQLIPAVLQQAGMYSLAKAKLPLELQLLEKEAEKIDADIKLTNKQLDLTTAQIAQATKQTDILAYELKYKLPVEVENMTAQTIKVVADVNNTIKEGKLIDANRCRVNAETAMIQANLTLKMPKEISMMDKEILLRQSQIDLGVKDLALKGKQVDIATKELSLKDEELKLAQYNFTYKAPSEVAKTKAEAEYYQWRAKSERAQTDPSAVMSGSYLDKNMKVLDEQSRQYLRSSQQSLVANMIDTWKVRYNADPDNTSNNATAQNKLADPYIGAAITRAAAEVGISL